MPFNSNVTASHSPNGIHFIGTAGTVEFSRRWNPQPGDIVTFKHHGYLLATKTPKRPTLYRLRHDLHWTDVVLNWKEKKITPTRKVPFHIACLICLQSPGYLNARRRGRKDSGPTFIIDRHTFESWRQRWGLTHQMTAIWHSSPHNKSLITRARALSLDFKARSASR